VASPFFPVLLLPLAIYFHRRARQEAASDARYVWRQRWFDRPVVIAVLAWAGFLLLAFLLIVVPALLGQNIA
jgi:hypothetical protein